MSVSLHLRKNLGTKLTGENIIYEMANAIRSLEADAQGMGVTPNWTRIDLQVGDAYDEYVTLGERLPVRSPYMTVSVPAWKEAK